jgi:hypothetical protein
VAFEAQIAPLLVLFRSSINASEQLATILAQPHTPLTVCALLASCVPLADCRLAIYKRSTNTKNSNSHC